MTTYDHDAASGGDSGGSAVVAAILPALAVLLTTYDDSVAATAEGGIVEAATAAILAFAAVLATLRGAGWAGMALALLYMRELDWDKALVADGILKLRLYTGDAPPADKAVGLAVVGFIFVVILRLVRRDGPRLVAALREGRVWAWLTVAAPPVAVLAKALDGIDRKLADVGIAVADNHQVWAVHVEEGLELGFAALLCGAVLAARPRA
jgi:hypothetical protein